MQTVLSERRAGTHRHCRPRRAYSFARARDLWVPSRCASVAMAMTPAFADLGSDGDTPLDWPGADSLVSWYHWRYDRQYNAALYGTGAVTPPAVTFTGSVPQNCGLQLDMPVGGARGTAQFRWSARNGDGTDWSAPILTAASVNLGNGITLQFANTAVYVTDNEYRLTITSFRDQTGNAHHWVTPDSAVSKYPVPRVSANGTGVSFDGVDDALRCQTSLATDLVGGTDNDFYACAVFKIEDTTPIGASGGILFFGDGATNRALSWTFTDANTFRLAKLDDVGTLKAITGGTPDTSLHVYELFSDGTTGTLLVDGASVATGDIDVGALTVTTVYLGATFTGGAEGNKANISWYELATYSSDLDATTRADIRARMRAPYGI